MDNQLISAVQDNNFPEVQRLLAAGANPNTRDSESGLTVLMMATGQANTLITQLLLESGADVFAN